MKQNFYRNIFAVISIGFFLAALTTKAPFAFFVAMLSGVLSRTAEKKGWSDPF